MSDSTPNQLREALTETARRHASAARPTRVARVRNSPGGYLAVAALLTFASLVCLRSQRDLVALLLIVGTWVAMPILMLTDRLSFDGQALSRTGLFAALIRLWRGHHEGIDIDDIERVEVATLRTLRRGGNVRYRYRIEISGKALNFAFASGGKEFRKMARCLLSRIPAHKLDARACDLRDHLKESKLVRAEAARLGVAPVSVLDAAQESRKYKRSSADSHVASEEETSRARMLRESANDLRVAGSLRQSGEAFRRAFHVLGSDPWLVYEYARLLRSQASAFSDARLLGRACAALKLASLRGSTDACLLERVGESFLEFGDPARAARIFRNASEIDNSAYRAQLGLAEVALGEGKLAHVIHHYNEATRIAPDKASARLARREADYYARLNNDEDYLAAELRRMNWLDGAGRVQHLAGRVTFGFLLIALLGPSVDQVVGGLGWALATSSIIAWSGSLIIRKVLAGRSRPQVTDA